MPENVSQGPTCLLTAADREHYDSAGGVERPRCMGQGYGTEMGDFEPTPDYVTQSAKQHVNITCLMLTGIHVRVQGGVVKPAIATHNTLYSSPVKTTRG